MKKQAATTWVFMSCKKKSRAAPTILAKREKSLTKTSVGWQEIVKASRFKISKKKKACHSQGSAERILSMRLGSGLKKPRKTTIYYYVLQMRWDLMSFV